MPLRAAGLGLAAASRPGDLTLEPQPVPDQPATNAINHLFAGVPVSIEHEGIENYSNGVRGRHAVRCVCGAGVESREHLNGSGVN